jgi:hypothetical protein
MPDTNSASPTQPEDSSDHTARTEHRSPPTLMPVVALLWLIMLPAWAALPTGEPPPPRPTRRTVNPNTASWWELAALPRIGPTTAHRIIEYRTQHAAHGVSENVGANPPALQPECAPRAFVQASDLINIRGIGPKTLLQIGPYLDF